MRIRTVCLGLAAASGAAAGAYLVVAGLAWLRYGSAPAADGGDQLLDRFMPEYDVVERHHVRVDAPPAYTLAAARDQDLMRSGPARLIFKARELALGATPDRQVRPRGLVDLTLSLGWGILAEERDHELVVGAVTQPWEPNVVFRPLPPGRFAAFDEPGYVKIAWTLRADPDENGGSLFSTETRAIATDAAAREKFRRYWAFASPGISAIRWLSLRPLKQEAERRARQATAAEAERAGGLP